MPIRLSFDDDLDDSYVSTGHIRTALTHPTGAVVIFHDGLVTAGPWDKVCRAYPQPMQRVYSRQELDLLVESGGVSTAATVANMRSVDWVLL